MNGNIAAAFKAAREAVSRRDESEARHVRNTLYTKERDATDATGRPTDCWLKGLVGYMEALEDTSFINAKEASHFRETIYIIESGILLDEAWMSPRPK